MKKIISILLVILFLVLAGYFGYGYFNAKDALPVTKTNVTNNTQEKKIKIIAVGDSLTAGYGLNLSQSYPSQLEKKLNDNGYSVQIINAGVSGETTAGLLERVEFIKSQKPDYVLITTGGNDALRAIDLNSTEKNMSAIIDSLTKTIPAKNIYLMRIKAPLNLGLQYASRFNTIYDNIEDEKNITVLPFVEEEVYLKQNLMQDDGVHPNEAGYKYIIDTYIYPKLSKEL